MSEKENYRHLPVMLEEVIKGLAIKPQGIYVDGTFGRGGHSAAILAALNEKGRLLAIDKDPEAVQFARQRFMEEPRFSIERSSFAHLKQVTDKVAITGKVDGILLDLGVSSPQLDAPERGFSFQYDGPLDMRMDPDAGISVAEWLATAKEDDISGVIKNYGEERFARRIARAIVEARTEAPIETTGQLTELVVGAIPRREKHKHPATRTFQALRIFINSELDELDAVLEQCVEVLGPGGRLAVISFHSLEDRAVKRFIRKQSQGEILPRKLPVMGVAAQGKLRAIGKAQRASEQECLHNPRSRSASLRIAERLQ